VPGQNNDKEEHFKGRNQPPFSQPGNILLFSPGGGQ